MATKIRLSRGGAKKNPFYRIVVSDSRSPRDSSFIEKIGTYNPLLADENGQRVVLDTERAKYWLSVGATPSDRVQLFLFRAGLVKDAPKHKPARKKRKEAKSEPAAAAPAADAA